MRLNFNFQLINNKKIFFLYQIHNIYIYFLMNFNLFHIRGWKSNSETKRERKKERKREKDFKKYWENKITFP